MLLSEGQMSDYKGAAPMIDALPKAKALLADRGYDADWFRAALAERGITACIPSKANRKLPIPHDTALYRQHHKIENMLANSRTGAASTCVRILRGRATINRLRQRSLPGGEDPARRHPQAGDAVQRVSVPLLDPGLLRPSGERQ
jgi:transposase